MGVTHKLKEDVITFIVEQKKTNPSIGVRKLAELTSERFQTQVSKSSVNTVLKNAALSSAVGRRPGSSAKPAKFSIPTKRKLEISKNMQKAGLLKEEKPKEEAPLEPGKKTQQDSSGHETGAPAPAETEPAAEESVPLMPDPVAEQGRRPKTDNAEFLSRVESLRAQKQNTKSPHLSGMGYVFLKAAQWETSGKSLISELFKKYTSGSAQDTFIAACEMYLYLKFLGVKTFEHISDYQDHGLWQLNKMKRRNIDESEVLLKIKDLFHWGKDIEKETATGIIVEYGLEKLHAHTEVAGFELITEDGSKFILDADLSKFDYGHRAPINKAMTWLSNYIISNIKSPLFFVAPGEMKIDQLFYDAVSVFENLPGKAIRKVSVMDKDKKEIAEFTTIPAQRRYFCIGVSPRQKEFGLLTKNAKWSGKNPYYHGETDRIVYYGETKSGGLAGQLKEKIPDFRVVTLWNDQSEDPFWAILTNIEKEACEGVVAAYISRWPNFGLDMDGRNAQDNHSAAKNPAAEVRTELKFEDIFSDYIKELSHYCQAHYFPPNYAEIEINNMIEMVYELSGTYYESDSYVLVTLDVPDSSPYGKDIHYAIRSVNERHIFDHSGRKIWINPPK